MTKTELLSQIGSKVHWIGTETKVSADGVEPARYDVPVVVRLPNDTYDARSQPIIVIDEGTSDEEALLARQEQADAPAQTEQEAFRAKARSAADNYVANNADVARVVIDSLDHIEDFATLTVYNDDGVTVTKIPKFALYDAANDSWTLRDYAI